MQTKQSNLFVAKMGLVFVLTLLLSFVGTGQVAAQLEVHFLDVGQAEATLLRTPEYTILIDAGDRGRDVLDHLTRLGVEKLDLMIFTHPHADHIGQGKAILENFAVEEVWLSGYEHTTKMYSDLLDAILATDAYYHEPRRGEVIEFGKLKLEILHPHELSSDLHHTNIVIRAVYGEVVFIFTGDAEVKTEKSILASGLPVQAQILQLGHHGSRTSSGIEFVLAVDPKLVVYSAGVANDYGHPHPEVVERIIRLGLDLYGTDVSGTMVVTTNGTDYDLKLEKVGDKPIGFKIDLNTASLEELQRIVHIGQERAEEIVRLRSTRPFRSLDDLKQVSGLGTKRIEDIKEQGLAWVKE